MNPADVLVIEDNPQNRYLLRFLLEKSGYVVREARDAEEGLAAVEDQPPGLILLDIQLPGMDGYALARKLREKPELDRVPIIAVTSYAMAGDRERALESGCDDHIEKPIRPLEVLALVDSLLRGQAA